MSWKDSIFFVRPPNPVGKHDVVRVHVGWVIFSIVVNIFLCTTLYLERANMWGKWERHWQVEWKVEQRMIQYKVDKAIEDFQEIGNYELKRVDNTLVEIQMIRDDLLSNLR